MMEKPPKEELEKNHTEPEEESAFTKVMRLYSIELKKTKKEDTEQPIESKEGKGFDFSSHESFIKTEEEKIEKESTFKKIINKTNKMILAGGCTAGMTMVMLEALSAYRGEPVDEKHLMMGILGAISSGYGIYRSLKADEEKQKKNL